MWAAIFPGQGSQNIGMGKFLYDNFALAQKRFDETSDLLHVDFKKLCFEGPEADLNLTENTQVVLLLVSTLCYDILHQNTGVDISAGSGHSVGEYSALVSSGVMRFADALPAVRARGIAMQRAVPIGDGGMLAVLGPDEDEIKEVCAWAEKLSGFKPLEPANYNSPSQIVISGSAKACQWLATQNLKLVFPDLGRVKMIPLKVSAPFHCSMMKPAEDEMRKVLQKIEFSEAKWPVIQNFSAQTYSDPQMIREQLVRQITGSVLWTQCMEKLLKIGCKNFIEFGSGKVLSGLAKKIDSEGLNTFNMTSLEELKSLELKIKEMNVIH